MQFSAIALPMAFHYSKSHTATFILQKISFHVTVSLKLQTKRYLKSPNKKCKLVQKKKKKFQPGNLNSLRDNQLNKITLINFKKSNFSICIIKINLNELLWGNFCYSQAASPIDCGLDAVLTRHCISFLYGENVTNLLYDLDPGLQRFSNRP